jgi:hypothetical protein
VGGGGGVHAFLPGGIEGRPRFHLGGMRVQTFSALFLLMTLMLVYAIAAQVFVDDYIKPHSMFNFLVLGTLITGTASLAVDIDIPS